jgi:addiction module RelB/DinJ family antitoxin
METTLFRARVNAPRAAAAQKILAGLGVTPAGAVNMLFAQIVARRGLPFDVQETGEAYALAEYGVTGRELAAARRRVDRSLARERKARTIKTFAGDWRTLKQ